MVTHCVTCSIDETIIERVNVNIINEEITGVCT